uniref:SRCR domain-containing protein n=1 Tax=Sinocyclocheilus anshuiensis TaxID=1608454 RepID=A0A671QXP5_9TELE
RIWMSSRCSGRLEILHDQTWMSVCDAAFDQQDEEVVCRELDCGAPVQMLGAAAFDKGDAQMWTQVIQCRGNESQIHLCPTTPLHENNCSHEFNIGLLCTGRNVINVRLVNGTSHCAGRVEVLHRGQWGTVCGAGWDLADAAVVCRELDCGEPVDALGDAHFGLGSRPVLMKIAICTGSKSTIKKCGSIQLPDKCLDKSAQVICSEVRLVGGSRCSGRLEILHDQTWMSVCDAAFDQQDAEVVCRELDCGAPVQVLGAAQIHLCPTNSSHKHSCSHEYSVGLVCAVRLVGGNSRCAGRVEVLHRGQWGTVCGAGWDLADAAVVCRELDCGEPVDALGDAHFGLGSRPVLMKIAICTGSKSTIKKCGSIQLPDKCLDKSAQVICSGKLKVLLVGGSRCSGRLEILHDQTWMSVCDAAFDQQDAEVVCRELDCGAPVQVLGAAAFDKGDTQMWTQEIRCRGNESQIHLCPTNSSHKHSCSHEYMRLVGGNSRCAGRVEVLHRGQWGTVCGVDFDMADAAVVCRELDCGEPVDVVVDAHFGSGSGAIWPNRKLCTGSESTLKNCGSVQWGSYLCDHTKDAGAHFLSLATSGARLIGNSSCSGRLEILHDQMWMSVCDAAFDQQDAEVVCRELDCGAPVQVLGGAAFGKGDAQMWTHEIQCRGNESQIHLCPTSLYKNHCSDDNFQGLFCSLFVFFCDLDRKNVRLVDGNSPCAGRVEVLHRGQWGTVCGDFWDLADAAVVCRELDCGEPVDALTDDHFGHGSGPVWMSALCIGSESTLKKCGSSGWSINVCTHNSNAGVICSVLLSIKHFSPLLLGHEFVFMQRIIVFYPSRLAAGSHLCSGRLEILHDQTWMSVCDAAFDQQDAEVVCRELDCGAPVQVLGAAAFGKGDTQMWTQDIQCRGNESQISFCSISSHKHNCSSDNNVGLKCSRK